VTIEKCSSSNEAVFLKHRAVRDVYNNPVAVPCLSVWMRSVGRCIGEMVGPGRARYKARHYVNSVTRSFASGFTVPCLESVIKNHAPRKIKKRAKILIEREVAAWDRYKWESEPGIRSIISDETYLGLYLDDPDDVTYLATTISNCEVGTWYNHETIQRVLSAGYGLQPAAEWVEQQLAPSTHIEDVEGM